MIDAVLDLSHWNGVPDFRALAQAGIVGIIGKATQGTRITDSHYHANKVKALAAGMLWGAYHFANGEDPDKQADHFFSVVKPDAATLLALDLENSPSGGTMTLAGAVAFVTRIHEKTGRWPLLYSGNLIKEYLGRRKEPTLANCPLWLAQYGPRAVIPPNWSHWTLWQFTSSRKITGIRGNVDSNRFAGTVDELRAVWTGRPQEDITPMMVVNGEKLPGELTEEGRLIVPARPACVLLGLPCEFVEPSALKFGEGDYQHGRLISGTLYVSAADLAARAGKAFVWNDVEKRMVVA